MATDFMHACNQVMRGNRDGSFATQTDRRRTLALVDRQLRELGVRRLQLRNLGSRHLAALLARWQQEGLTAGTIKNRMSHLRWLSDKIDKRGLIPRSNASNGIPSRKYVTNQDRSVQLDLERLNAVCDPYLSVSFRLQAEFGLRREEAMKIRPALADHGGVLHLDKTKGGRPRDIPIRTLEQRALLEEAKTLAGGGSLIPPELRYVEQLNRYKTACIRMGLEQAHGLRHGYAQQRYLELAGRPCPAAGGMSRREMSSQQRREDNQIRLQISAELGHGRIDVTSVYLGA